MLLDLLSQHLGDVAAEVRELEDAKVERYEEEILAANRVNLRIRIRFLSGYLLELNEAAIVEAEHIRHLGYRYHFQNSQNNLVFRYDNTPHFSEINSFPHHKHLKDNVVAVDKPSILKVIEEARLLAQ
ncbi:MAG: DUF6516 family protein [Deltaproteobacteria bacterium]|jgi:hypothetical protein|nr:DUF6516 family protein [Deltaproteobacteria bacterium]